MVGQGLKPPMMCARGRVVHGCCVCLAEALAGRYVPRFITGAGSSSRETRFQLPLLSGGEQRRRSLEVKPLSPSRQVEATSLLHFFFFFSFQIILPSCSLHRKATEPLEKSGALSLSPLHSCTHGHGHTHAHICTHTHTNVLFHLSK